MHDALGRAIAKLPCRGEMQQAMRIESVAGTRIFQMVFQPDLSGDPGHARIHRRRLLRADAVFARQHLHQRARPLARRLRFQFEAAPDHLYVIPLRKIGKRRFKAPFADVAPRADHVRPDFDFHVRCLLLQKLFNSDALDSLNADSVSDVWPQ